MAISRTVKVENEYGLHARPAAMFVKAANRFQCDIVVEKDGLEVSGKSIMGLLTIEGHQGAKLKITADGPDAEQAIEALETLFANQFDEG